MKEFIMTDFLEELKLIIESTTPADKEVRDAVDVLAKYALMKQGWTEEDFKLK